MRYCVHENYSERVAETTLLSYEIIKKWVFFYSDDTIETCTVKEPISLFDLTTEHIFL